MTVMEAEDGGPDENIAAPGRDKKDCRQACRADPCGKWRWQLAGRAPAAMLRGMADEASPSAPTRDPSVPPAPDAARPSTPAVPERGEAPEARWFGFREVDPNAKAPMVRQVFDSVATNYDLMNDLMSGGVHRLWKSTLIEMIKPRPGMTLLDVAGGTGDISFRFLDAAGGAGPTPSSATSTSR